MSQKIKNIFYLRELPDYKVDDAYEDVRGWVVKDAGNRSIGKVEGLLVNKKEEKVVYLDVKVDQTVIEEGHKTFDVPADNGVHGFMNKEGDDHLIIPIGMARLNIKDREVQTNQIDYLTFAKASRFSSGTAILPEYELKIYHNYLGRNTGSEKIRMDDDFYKRLEFANSLRRRDL